MSLNPDELLAKKWRPAFVEPIYCQAESFGEYIIPPRDLLLQVASIDKTSIQKNIDILFEKNGSPPSNFLHYHPGLEPWMLIDLYDITGNELMQKISRKFIRSPYEYRKGWPDLTIWKNGEIRFIEIKSPKDKIQKSQVNIIKEFAEPLKLNFFLARVIEL